MEGSWMDCERTTKGSSKYYQKIMDGIWKDHRRIIRDLSKDYGSIMGSRMDHGSIMAIIMATKKPNNSAQDLSDVLLNGSMSIFLTGCHLKIACPKLRVVQVEERKEKSNPCWFQWSYSIVSLSTYEASETSKDVKVLEVSQPITCAERTQKNINLPCWFPWFCSNHKS